MAGLPAHDSEPVHVVRLGPDAGVNSGTPAPEGTYPHRSWHHGNTASQSHTARRAGAFPERPDAAPPTLVHSAGPPRRAAQKRDATRVAVSLYDGAAFRALPNRRDDSRSPRVGGPGFVSTAVTRVRRHPTFRIMMNRRDGRRQGLEKLLVCDDVRDLLFMYFSDASALDVSIRGASDAHVRLWTE
jgi:hypothetical protein